VAQKIKTVPIQLDKPRHLRFDVNALLDLGDELEINLMTKEGWEELVGKTVVDETTREEKFVPVDQSFRRVRAIIWAGLRHEDEALTIRQVGAMLDPANLGAAIAAYTEAMAVEGEEKEAGESPNAGGSSAARA